MKEIQLTRGKVALVDDEDFEELNRYKWCLSGDGKYARRCIGNNIGVYMHSAIMDTPKGMHTDHVNHKTLDNRKENLRVCTGTQNILNSGKQRNNTSGYKGVTYITNKAKRVKRWMAQTSINYKHIVIGYFRTAEEAALAYDRFVVKHFGEFAGTNFGDSR